MKNSEILSLRLCYLNPIKPVHSKINNNIDGYLIHINCYESRLMKACYVPKKYLTI